MSNEARVKKLKEQRENIVALTDEEKMSGIHYLQLQRTAIGLKAGQNKSTRFNAACLR